ncbi:protein timeless homolog isoform X2 [Bombus terrestris]|uniref:Protein timeless homolog isoform X2 n=1 Tax=Bombus terrestris TaxID=30195 RepID=A0A9C6W7G6_BOMTE|nr:protein timeless homolog isoform X2 [Bombus terrestris]
MSDYLSTELAATCAALGYYDGSKYHLDNYCLDVIKDLIKYLRRDDESHTVRQFLGQTKVLQTDLIKIFVDHYDKLELWDVLLRLIINITSPVVLLFNEQIPTDIMQRTIYLKLVAYTQSYKVALIDGRIWTILSNRLSKILKLDNVERGEENEMVIERILIFIRNVLQILPDENEKRVDNDATVHDEVLYALNTSGIVDLLVFIASNRSEQQYHLQVLEIISLMLRDQSASELARSGLQRSLSEKEKDEETLLAARLKEKEKKIERVRKYTGARHSHFGGTYVVQNMKAIGENQLLCHKPYQKIEALNFGQDKKKVSKPKNKRPMWDPRGERTSALSVRLILKEFCIEFLNAAYNPVMKYSKSCIVSGAQTNQSETTCYLWALRFFMEFNRHYKFEVKYVRQYLIDLTTTAHIFLKMLSNYCGRNKRSVIVQKVKPTRYKRTNKKKAVQKEQPPVRSLEERWDEVSPQLSIVMQEGTIPQVIPFDATLDVPIDDQKVDAMKRVQKLLRSKDLEQAIGLIRAAREVWPENDSFGSANITSGEEFLALREIFFADLGVVEENPVTQSKTHEEENVDSPNDESEEDEENASQTHSSVVETDFKFPDFIHRFANVKIVRAMLVLLQQFDKNTNEVNHYITKMLHRIAWDCKMPGLLFQASMFRVFQRILESKYCGHKELQKFAVFIIRRFIEVAQKNRKAYMELLFWKTTRDATEVVEGYNAETDNKKVPRSLWTETQEDELRTLFMEHQTNKYSQDVVDWILEHINQERTRRGIMKKLKEMCLIVNSKTIRNEVQKRLPKVWSEDEISQLTELWEQLKQDDDPVDLIFNGLTIKRPKPKIKEKLLELGLATDRKELRKKRSRKSNHGKSSWETQSASNSDEDESSDEEAGKSSSNRNVAPNKPTNKGKKKNAKKQPTMVYTDAQLSGLLKDVIEKNMSDALEWIKESLLDVLDDRDEESCEGIPLVPLTDYSSAAMDSPSFQKLIRAMGFTPPADEQESYWRIPSNMPRSMIQKRCNLIESSLAGNFIAEEATSAKVESDNDRNSESDDEDVLENIKKYFTSKAEPQPSTSGMETNVHSTPKPLKKTTVLSSPTECDDVEMEEAKANNSQPVEKSKSGKRKFDGRIIAFDDSSDSELEIKTNADNAEVAEVDDGKRPRSDDEKNDSVKKRRLLDSDEEEEPLTSQATRQKSIKTIISDDEEEPAQNQRNQHRSTHRIISDDED